MKFGSPPFERRLLLSKKADLEAQVSRQGLGLTGAPCKAAYSRTPRALATDPLMACREEAHQKVPMNEGAWLGALMVSKDTLDC